MSSVLRQCNVLVIPGRPHRARNGVGIEDSAKARLHLKFLRLLEKYCLSYTLLDIDAKKTNAKVIYEKYNPDLVIGYSNYGFSRTFFADFPCKTALIETDFYKKINDLGWYRANKFDLLIQRGAYDKNLKIGTPMVFLPFSADHNVFFPNPDWNERSDLVGFAGSKAAKIYNIRRKAISILNHENLIDVRARRMINYPAFIRSVKMFLTSTEINSAHGKAFETLASGTVLLSSPFSTQEELFGPRGVGYVLYKNNCSNLIQRVNNLREKNDNTKKIAEYGYNRFLKYHSDNKRILELNKHLSDLMEDRPVEKIWSI